MPSSRRALVWPAWQLPLRTIHKTVRGGVGLAAHHLVDEPSERLDPGLLFDTVEESGVVDVPGGEVGERAVAAGSN